jgi:hypothetical protein
VATSYNYFDSFNFYRRFVFLLTFSQIYGKLKMQSVRVSQTTSLNPSIGFIGK